MSANPRLVARSIQRAAPPARLFNAVVANEQHALRLTIGPGQAGWVCDEGVTQEQLGPGQFMIGAVIAERGLPTVTITPGLTSKVATISNAKYQILDDQNAFGAWLQEKTSNDVQLFGGTVEHFIIPAGTSLVTDEERERALAYTWQTRGNIDLDRAVFTLNCEDITRNLERDIFEERQHTLFETIQADTESEIIVYLPPEERDDLVAATWAFEHAEYYRLHPGETRAIGLIQNGDTHEFISWSHLEPTGATATIDNVPGVPLYRCVNPARGLFGTVVSEWTIDPTQQLSSRLAIKSHPYAEEHRLSMAMAAATGYTADGRYFPWGLDLTDEQIDRASFPLNHERQTYRGMESQQCKEFIEEHCLAGLGLMYPQRTGALTYTGVPIGSDAATVNVLLSTGNTRSDQPIAIEADEKDTRTGVIINWDRDPVTGEFRKKNDYRFLYADGQTSATDPEIIDMPYLTTGWTTESQARELARIRAARHALAVNRFKLHPIWDMWRHTPGTVALASLPVMDFTRKGGVYTNYFGKIFIASMTRNHNERTLSWSGVSYQPTPPGILQESATPPDSFFTNGGTLITSTNGIADLGQTLVTGRKYYTLEPVEYPEGFFDNIQGNGTLILYAKETALWADHLDGTGRGGAGGAGASSGAGANGEDGYIPARPPSGSVDVQTHRFVNSSNSAQGFTRRRIQSRPPAERSGATGAGVQASVVSILNDQLVGVPQELQGAGGAGGDSSIFSGTKGTPEQNHSPDNRSLNGSNGGNGSLSVLWVCPPGSGFVGGGKATLNGVDGEPSVAFNDTWGAGGAGGAHGFFDVYHFGQGTPVQFDSTRLIARHGKAVLSGTPTTAAAITDRFGGSISLPQLRGFYDPDTSQDNEWASAHRVTFLPATQTAEDITYTSSFAQFFSTQPDGRVNLIISDVPPSDGNYLDMYISADELRNGGASPIAYQFTETGWSTTPYNWADQYANVYAALISLNRENQGAVLYAGTTLPAVFNDGDGFFNVLTGERFILREDGNHELFGLGEYPVGDALNVDPKYDRQRQVLAERAQGREREDYWKFSNDLPPRFIVDGQPVVSPVITPTFPLAAPTLSASIYSATSVELFIGHPVNIASVTEFELRRDGVLLSAVPLDQSSHLDTVQPSGTYIYTARSVNAAGERSADATISVSTGARTGGTDAGGTVLSVTMTGAWTGSWPESAATFGLSVSVATGSSIAGSATGYDGRAGFISGVTDPGFTGFSSNTVASGAWTATPPAGMPTGRYKIFITDAAGANPTTTEFDYTEPASSLPAVVNLAALIYGPTSGELQWSQSGDAIKFEIRQNGVLIETLNGVAFTSYFMSTLTPDTQYTWSVIKEAADGTRSNAATVTERTNP